MHPGLKSFSQAAAETRRDWFAPDNSDGTPKLIKYWRANGNTIHEISAVISGVVSTRELTDGGFKNEALAICRILRTAIDFRPALGDKITYGDNVQQLVNEVVDNPINPEWRIGLIAAA